MSKLMVYKDIRRNKNKTVSYSVMDTPNWTNLWNIFMSSRILFRGTAPEDDFLNFIDGGTAYNSME